MDETTITFSILLIVLIPLSTYVGYRLGYFRGYVAARHLFLQSLTKNVILWSHNGVSRRWDASKAKNNER